MAVNPVTGNIYTTTCLLDQRKPATNGSVTVIDVKTYTTTRITAGVCPSAVAVNPVTNRIYVANAGQTSIVCGSCFNRGSVTIIDGATNAATEIADPNAKYPAAIAVNTTTNKIYVANSGTGNVTVIDGVTRSTTTITDPNVAAVSFAAYALAVNETTNKIYVVNNDAWRFDPPSTGNVTVIDGATNTTTTVTDPNAVTPYAVAVNSKTNRIYVANQGSGYPGPNRGNVTIIDGATNSTLTVTDPSAVAPQAIVVNEATDQIYVANINDTSLSGNGGITVIDGATNSVISVKDPNAVAPIALAVDQVTNKVYVANEGSGPQSSGNNPGSVTVVDGATNTTTTVIGPNAPHAVAINATLDQVYVATSGVTVIDGGGTPTTHALGVVMAGTGRGTVTSNPLGINCEPACAESVAVGSAVSLNALATSGSIFAGWSGPCTGTGSCDLVANSDQFITATFNSTAPAPAVVPNVVGMTQATATSAIAGAGLTTGTVGMQSSTTVAAGNVISESPAADTHVASGSPVNLVVSTGSSGAGGTAAAGGNGGGGGIDAISLGALLCSLIVWLRAGRRLRGAAARNRYAQIDAAAAGLAKEGFPRRRTLLGRIFALLLLLGAGLAEPSAAQQFVSSPRARSGQPGLPVSRLLGDPARRSSRQAEASREISWTACPAPAVSAGASECGYLRVPIFAEPSSPTIDIYFEIYSHDAPGPAVSAIFANGGGPGLTTTGARSLVLSLYGVALDVHDMVLFDDRGRGSSAAIDCSDLQHGTAPFHQAVAECAAQLGARVSAYGTGAIADDAEALRVALGYDKIDYLGLSYGAEDATAYATRYGAHLRSIILDAPAGSPYLAVFTADRGSTQSIPQSVTLGCRRSPTCSADHPDPDSELSALIHSIHNHPLIGFGNNAFGSQTAVSLDEGSLAALLTAGTFPPVGPPGSGGFVDNNEVLAAAQAYATGDSVPLLRIGAEGIIPLSIDYGDPTFFSEGAFIATQCVDMQQPFRWSDPVSLRSNELSESIGDLPADFFAPFTTDVARYPIFAFEGQCLDWQKPTPSDPVVASRPVFPDVPVLVLHGDMDAVISTAEARAVAAQFPQSTFVAVASSGHITAAYGLCGANISNNFLETLQTGDTTCARTPEIVWPAVGRFPLLASDALPAESAPGNRGTTGDLKVVSVAVATMKDALQRTTLGSTSGVGLRGGTFQDAVGTTAQVITLNGCLFTQDVSVSGVITYGFDTSVSASLSVTLSDGTTGSLRVTGAFLNPGPAGYFSVTGSIGARQIAALVPEA